VARKDKKDSQNNQQQNSGNSFEGERESVVALKSIMSKLAPLVKPLGLSPEESTHLVEELYGRALEIDMKLAREPDQKRRKLMLQHLDDTTIQREDGELAVNFPE